MFGDRKTSRDYKYIDDIIDGIIKPCDYKLKQKDVYEILNLSNSLLVSYKGTLQTH